MSISRRQFIRGISAASLVTLGGKILPVSAGDVSILQERSALRFVVASDGHFGQPDTEYVAMHHTMVKQINNFHKNHPLDFCVINGDLIHDDKSYLIPVKGVFDKLPVKYYVTKGNHDLVSDEYWKQIWGIPVNHEVVMGNNVLLLATTSNEKGEYLSPDLAWMKARLDAHVKASSVFVFIHIPQTVWNKGGIETPAFFELMKAYKNIRAVFHGHEHDQDGVKVVNKVPYMFDSHIGGSWGTSYRGFRVVELTQEKGVLTYIMNPTEIINQASY